MFSPGVQLLAASLLQLHGWMFACPAHCLLLLVPLQVGTALHVSAVSNSIFSRCSGGAGKGLPAKSQVVCGRFLETQQNHTVFGLQLIL